MARITVEQSALTDSRYDILALELGCDRHGALGRMLLVWNECQERELYDLEAESIAALLGSRDGAAAMVKARLGEQNEDGTVRVCGCQGRIEWLAKRRAEGRAGGQLGGRPKKPLGDTPKITPGGKRSDPGRIRVATPPAPAPAPAPAQKTGSSDELPSGNGDRSPSSVITLKAGAVILEIDQARIDRWRKAYPRASPTEAVPIAQQWLDDNPHRRPKSKRGLSSFMSRWLARNHERATQVGGVEPRIEPEVTEDEIQAEIERGRRARGE